MENLDIFEKIADSSKKDKFEYRINDNDMINYFDFIVNSSNLITDKKVNLKIIYEEEKNVRLDSDELNKSFKFDDVTNTYFFNAYNLIASDKVLPAYAYNIEAIEQINMMVADNELRKMVNDNITYQIEPLFYSYLVSSFTNNNYGPIIDNFIKFRSIQLTSNCIDIARNNFKLNPLMQLDYASYGNQKIMETLEKRLSCDNSCPINDDGFNDLGFMINKNGLLANRFYNKIKAKFGEDVLNKFKIAIQTDSYSLNYDILANLLYGKPISEEDYNELVYYSKRISLIKMLEDLNSYTRNKKIGR